MSAIGGKRTLAARGGKGTFALAGWPQSMAKRTLADDARGCFLVAQAACVVAALGSTKGNKKCLLVL